MPRPRRFEYGQLTHGNVDAVAKRMTDMFRGKYFSVASIVIRRWTERVDLETDNVLRAEWTDGSRDLVRVKKPDEFKSSGIMFSGKSYFYSFFTNLDETISDSDWKHDYFAFDSWDTMRIRCRVPAGDLHLLTLRVERDMENDPKIWSDPVLKDHFGDEANLEKPTVWPKVAAS